MAENGGDAGPRGYEAIEHQIADAARIEANCQELERELAEFERHYFPIFQARGVPFAAGLQICAMNDLRYAVEELISLIPPSGPGGEPKEPWQA